MKRDLKHQIHRAINVEYQAPRDLLPILNDFVSMVNHLVSYGLWAGRPKNPDRNQYWLETKNKFRFSRYQLCADTTDWFENNWRTKYAAHYHEAACSLAAQQLTCWRATGGNVRSLPYLSEPLIRLRKDLFRPTLDGDRLEVRVTTSRHKYLTFNATVNHGKLKEYRAGSVGEMTLHKDYFELIFSFPDNRPNAEKHADADTNFESIDFALEDEIVHVSLGKVVAIQELYKEERKRIQRAIPKNLQKQRKVLRRRSNREHNRVEQVIRKEIVPEILEKTKGHNIRWDDLSQTTQECVLNSSGRRFHERLSSWIHGRIQEVVDDKSTYRASKLTYTRGSSTYCPFDGSKLRHPMWRISRCEECGVDYDRDSLSAIVGKVRASSSHMKGEHWKVAKEVLPEEQVEALSKAAQCGSLPRERAYLQPNEREVGSMGSSPSKGGGFTPNAASRTTERGAASPTKDMGPESHTGEVGQNDSRASTTLARPEDRICPQRTT